MRSDLYRIPSTSVSHSFENLLSLHVFLIAHCMFIAKTLHFCLYGHFGIFPFCPSMCPGFFFCVLCPFNILHTLAAIMATLQIRTNSELFGSFAGKFDVYLFFCVTSTKFLKMRNNAVRATDVFWGCTGCPVFHAMTATHDVLQFVCKF